MVPVSLSGPRSMTRQRVQPFTIRNGAAANSKPPGCACVFLEQATEHVYFKCHAALSVATYTHRATLPASPLTRSWLPTSDSRQGSGRTLGNVPYNLRFLESC